jgi:cell division topological specificity factor
MSLLNYFKKKKTATAAKDRLQIIIAQQRTDQNSTDFLPLLRKDIIAAISKHMEIDPNAVQVDLQCKDNNTILELNVALPETIEA